MWGSTSNNIFEKAYRLYLLWQLAITTNVTVNNGPSRFESWHNIINLNLGFYLPKDFPKELMVAVVVHHSSFVKLLSKGEWLSVMKNPL